MAVEIPVIVDIDQAFVDAANRVSAAIKPLERAVSDAAMEMDLGIKVEIDDAEVTATLKEIKENGAAAFGGIGRVIDAVNSKLVALAQVGNEADFKALLEAKHYLLDMQTASETAKLDIEGLANSLRGLRANISAANITLENSPIHSPEWEQAAIDLERYKKQLSDVELEIKSISTTQAKADFSKYIEDANQKLEAANAHMTELKTAMKGLMSGKEMAIFEPDAAKYQQIAISLEQAQQSLNKMSGFGEYIDQLSTVNFELLQMREYYRDLEKSSREMSTSINGYRERIEEINRQWREMTASEKFLSDGTMTREAKKLYDTMKRETEEMEKQGKELSSMLADEKRIEQLKQQGIQKRQRENAILTTSVKTLNILREKEKILSDQLNRTTIGSSKYEQLKRQLKEVREEIDRVDDSSKKAGRSLSSLIVNAVKLYALHSAARFVQNIREVTAEFELQKVSLGSIIRDTQRAEDLFRQIKATAIESPFEIKDLVSYTKQLSAYQIETDKLFDTTKKLADVSAGLGVDMSRLVLAYGQVRAASVLRGQELRQFTEAGIPLVDKLAEKFQQLGREGTTTADVFQLISERAVPFRMIEEIFDDMTSAGGMFYKMQEKQAKTLAGQWANLKDAASIMYDEIGNTDSVHRAMETLIADARSIMLNWRQWAGVIKSAGSALVVYIGYEKAAAAATALLAKIESAATAAESTREKGMRRLITSIIGKTGAEKISTQATKLHTIALFRAVVASNTLSKAFWQLTAAMLNNPFGFVAVAVAGLVSVFSSLQRKARDVGQDVDAAKASIEALNKTRGETQKLIDDYDELRKKEKLSADEAKKMRDITEELAKVFPKASEGIDKSTGALALNIEKLKEYNSEAKKASEKAINAQIRIDEKEIKRNERQIDRLTTKINSGLGKFNPVFGVLGYLFQTDKQITEMDEKIVKLRDTNEKYTQSINEMRDALAGMSKETDNADKTLQAWQNKLIEFNERQLDYNGKMHNIQVLSPDQIKNYSKLDEALDDLAKDYKNLEERVKILTGALEGKNEEEAKEIRLALALATARRDLTKEILDYYNAFWLTTKNKKSGEGYQKDPFITKMENWMKFMKDFRKGYDDLRKYMSEQGALDKQFEIMQSRGLAMGISSEEQRRAATDLSKWYEDTAKKAFAEAKKHGATGSMASFMSQQISDKTTKGKTLRAFQELLQSLFDAKTDFDTTQAKENIEKAIEKLTNDIKKTETARNFFNEILDLTGDQDLAANLSVSVYGGVGKDFKDRIQEQLYRALKDVEPENIDKDLMSQLLGDITVLDIDDIQKNLDQLPPRVKKLFEEILAENQRYNADWLVDFEKTYTKAASYEKRISRLQQQREQKEREAEQMGRSPEEKARITAYYNQKIAEVQLEALKDTYTWTKAFEDLDGVSSRTLDNLIALIDEYITKNGQYLEPNQLKELTRAKERAEAQKIQRNGYLGVFDALKKLFSKERAFNIMQEHGMNTTEAINAMLDDQSHSLKQLEEAYEAAMEEMNAYMSSAKDLMSVFASDEDASFFGGLMDDISKTMGGIGKAGSGILGILANPANASAWKQALTGIADIVVGIFNAAYAIKLKKINEQMKRNEELIESLEKSYERLEKAMADAFGSDYIYNYTKQLEDLAAKQAAYEEQARLEREKGKKADEDKIKEYQQSAEDAASDVVEMRGQLAEFFTGTDVASAAKDFANSWIEAYKEFGSTTSAMKEKFQELIQSMVEQSLGAKIVQTILQPLFEEIDNMAKEGGELSAQEIAQIAKSAPGYIEDINNAMTTLMNQLAAAGYNVRQGVGQFTGISRDIAGASEESINGLAAGINTQNFYMSQINQNVAAILASMTGGTDAAGVTRGAAAASEDPYKNQMLQFAGMLPEMHDDMHEVRRLLALVVRPNGTTSTHYVATRS